VAWRLHSCPARPACPPQIRTRAFTLPHPVSTAPELYAAAHRLLLPQLPCELRLMGLRVSGFVEPQRRERGQVGAQAALGA
jgi:hypothetical protein